MQSISCRLHLGLSSQMNQIRRAQNLFSEIIIECITWIIRWIIKCVRARSKTDNCFTRLNKFCDMGKLVIFQLEKTQKEYYLNEQMKAIQKELGENEDLDEIAELEKKLNQYNLSKEANDKCVSEIKKLKNTPN